MKNVKQKIKIVIVEDELIVAKNIENQLYKLGYDVPASAASGDEAITLVEKYRPDLVLMDIKLSGSMDGIDAASQIRSRFYIPVVYLTAYADNETLQRAKITDPFGYLLKPFELKSLHSTIEIALYKHQIENKLAQSELRFRTLSENSPVGIFQTDIDGDCIYVNKLWLEIAGITQEQAMGRGWISGLYPEDREAVTNAWYAMTESDGQFEREYRFQTPSGRITWLFGRAVPLKTETGEKIGYIGTITDITVHKRLEEELLTGKKLESIGVLAGGIAHDFNNLLSVILGTISIMKDDSNITKDQYMMLGSMEKASSQASELAQKLITFSKGGWLHRRKIDVSQLIEEVINPQFSNVSATFKIDIPTHVLPLNGDKAQLKQVFTNLVLNAVEAGGDNNEISITAENHDNLKNGINYALKPGQYVKVIIRDTGEGIAKEDLEKIFDPYFTTKEKGAQKGLGLGMSICYSIVQKHGGHINVKSEKCCGASVEVFLPIYLEETAPVHLKQAPQKYNKIRVMIMDDEPIVLDVTSKMLQRLGYEVEAYDEGEKALDAYKNTLKNGNLFDIVLLDLVNKRGIGGKETMKAIIELNPKEKVVALTGYSDASEVTRLKAFGFIDVLIKPYKINDLKEVLSVVAKK